MGKGLDDAIKSRMVRGKLIMADDSDSATATA
jgi:hypothetical protein